MKNKSILKKAIQIFNRYSPHPSLCPIILSHNEINLFDDTIKDSLHYLEFGMGGSTLRAIQKSKAKIYTVESSFDWIYKMRRYLIIRFYELVGRLKVFYVNIGPTSDWGFPIGDKYHHLFPDYSSTVFAQIDKSLIDTVFIDGRFRVACVLKTILECHKNNRLTILIHDYQRENYHIAEKYLEIVSSSDTLFTFRLKKDIELDLVRLDYESFKNNSE